jgi:hypothetical protein
MALRSDRHRIRPIAALAVEADTTIGPRCATIHVGQEAETLHTQAGYDRSRSEGPTISHSLANREESIYGLLARLDRQRPDLRSTDPNSRRSQVALGRQAPVVPGVLDQTAARLDRRC